MLSAWIAEQDQHCAINIGLWQDNGSDEASAWGIFLADTIRHIANALQEQYGKASPDTVAAILESLHNELADPSSGVQGEFVHGHS
jgi:hypothetical protein